MMDDTEQKRHNMIVHQIKARGIDNQLVIDTMMKIPRHKFVPDYLYECAYDDCALRVSNGQTISQPYIVAMMTSLIDGDKTKHALEIGTGTGYQTAVLAEICKNVVTIERIEELHLLAKARLEEMGYDNIECILGDGFEGYEKKAPYDVILVTACPPEIPQTLINQLAPGGKMVIPAGVESQFIYLVIKDSMGEISLERNIEVRFVSMIPDVIVKNMIGD